ncbi:MAG: TonB-dependent receptor [Verrucomicrobiota bacterium JB023]|nr:TonB-dependent receptor [Verrucomicrobiota bacterium JB023]
MRVTHHTALTLLLAQSPAMVQAQENTETPRAGMEVSETVVTASRLEEDPSDSPYLTEVVTSEDVLAESFRTLPESLALTPGVSVQKTTHGHGSPFIRGFTGRQNLYLVDGIRLNNSTYRSGPVQYANTVDVFGLGRFELVKSQGSVLYGSDALGGTLNAITASSGYLEQDAGWFHNGESIYRYDTNSQSHLTSQRISFGDGGKWGITLGATLKDFGDIETDYFGEMNNTGYPEQNYSAKLEFSPADNLHLTLAAQYLNQDDVWRWHSTMFNPGGWEDLAAGTFTSRIYDQERFLTYARIEHEPVASWIDRYSATFSYQTTQDSEFQDRNPNTEQIRFGNIEVDTYGFNFEAQSTLPAATTLAYGADYYEDRVNAEGYRLNTADGTYDNNRAPIAEDATYRSLGLYTQARTAWTEQFETTAGLRYTYAETDINSLDVEDDWQSVVFNARALYRFDDVWSGFGGYSQGFRAPNLNDLTGDVTSRSGLDSLGSLGLDPETTQTFEIGARAESGRFSFEAATFYTMVDDLIVRVDDGAGVEKSVNAAEAWIAGIEAEAMYRLSDCWSLNGFLTWQYGDTERPVSADPGADTIEEPVSRLSPLRGSLALRYDHPSSIWWAEARVLAAAEADRLSASDQGDTQRIPPGGTPGYVVAHLNAGWQATENLDFILGLQNLTDEDYRIHGSGVNEPGFGAQVTARVRW